MFNFSPSPDSTDSFGRKTDNPGFLPLLYPRTGVTHELNRYQPPWTLATLASFLQWFSS
jgi:hypothetical protein